MVKPGTTDKTGRFMRRAQHVLLLALVLLMVAPGIARADGATLNSVTTVDASPHDGHLDALTATFSAAPTSASSDYALSDGYAIDPTSGVTVSGSTATIHLVQKAVYDTGALPTVT